MVKSLPFPVHPVGFYHNAKIYVKNTTIIPNITLIIGHVSTGAEDRGRC